MILDRIEKENDIKDIPYEDLPELAAEIRELMIDTLSETGGHLASNLGTVELTMALHRVFDLPHDRIIWDVGHQSYTHKILTGRKDSFKTIRSYGGLSGFPDPEESECDPFYMGHSTNSLSLGLGLAMARKLTGEDYHVISVIGDGSLTGGMAYEAINNASEMKRNFIIVLNDNDMSISENVGSISKQLINIRTSDGYTGLKAGIQGSIEKIPIYGSKMVGTIQRTKNGIKQLVIPGMVFEQMGVMYLGPVDGHNIKAMEKAFREASRFKGAVLVHVKTKKGYGFEPAERHPARFHGADPFDRETGAPLKMKNPSYTDIFSTVMRKMGDREPSVVAVTAAMMDGTGLKRFHNMFPDRFFDVGIAEQHAVTFSAALASEGLRPVVAIYSSFLQRAYDQIMTDVCLAHLPVIFAVDRAGIVGKDGRTHQGVFDLSYLGTMPNMTIMAPKNKWELSDMMKFAVGFDGPIAIRYPRGEAYTGLKEHREPIRYGCAEEIISGKKVLLFAIGSMVETAMDVADSLKKEGIDATVTNARFAKPIDTKYLSSHMNDKLIVTMEENVRSGGFGERVEDHLVSAGFKGRVLNISIPDEFIPHGDVAVLKKELGIDAKSITKRILKAL